MNQEAELNFLFSELYDKALLFKDVCNLLLSDKVSEAGSLINEKYPFIPFSAQKQKYSNYFSVFKTRENFVDILMNTPRKQPNDKKRLLIWRRDKYTDRYCNLKLLFPGTIELVSNITSFAISLH